MAESKETALKEESLRHDEWHDERVDHNTVPDKPDLTTE